MTALQVERHTNGPRAAAAPIRLDDQTSLCSTRRECDPAVKSAPDLRSVRSHFFRRLPDGAEVDASREVSAEPEVLLNRVLPVAVILQPNQRFSACLHQVRRPDFALVGLIVPDLTVLSRLGPDQYRFPPGPLFPIKKIEDIVDRKSPNYPNDPHLGSHFFLPGKKQPFPG